MQSAAVIDRILATTLTNGLFLSEIRSLFGGLAFSGASTPIAGAGVLSARYRRKEWESLGTNFDHSTLRLHCNRFGDKDENSLQIHS
jgi:hypothetical protein